MHMIFAAMTGHGKSYHFQGYCEKNIKSDTYNGCLLLDYADEYRGLVKAGLLKHYIVGPAELNWSVSTWRQVIKQEPYLCLARLNEVSTEQWREVCARIIQAARSIQDYEPFIGIDEAHYVAPEGQLPGPITDLVTSGRGTGFSACFVTQRLAVIANTVLTQCDAAMLGGFKDSLSRLKQAIEYPEEVHRIGGKPVPGLPDDLRTPEGGAISLRKWTDENGTPTGSEWIYSDSTGETKRLNTANLQFDSTHYGQEGNQIHMPDYET